MVPVHFSESRLEECAHRGRREQETISGRSHRSESRELPERSALITVSKPGATGLPRLRERMSFLDGADREGEKGSDGFHHCLEFSLLDVGLVLRAKRGPLTFLVYVFIKLGRKGDGQTKQIARWSVQSPPDDWKPIRARWIRFHIVRTLFSLPGLACYILACLVSR